ncbi:hypothetical protein ACF044_02950 [Microbacterium sp. NPDC016588]
MSEASTGLDRRTVLKGAAWSAPIVAMAVATPLASASTGPTCPPCLTAGVLGAVTTQAVVVGNKGALAFVGALGLDSRGCDLTLFKPLYTIIPTSATLTMSDGTTHSGTGLAAGTGTFGQLGALPGTILFSNLSFPSGTYVLNSNPAHPTKIVVEANVILVGLPSLIEITCPVTLTYNLNVWGVGVVTPAFLGGTGTINFTGTATAA